MDAIGAELRGTAVDEEGKGGSGSRFRSRSRIGMMMLCNIQVCGLGAVCIAVQTAAIRSIWPVVVNGAVLFVAISKVERDGWIGQGPSTLPGAVNRYLPISSNEFQS